MLDLTLLVATAGGLFYWAKGQLPKPRRGSKTQDTTLFWVVIVLVFALYGM